MAGEIGSANGWLNLPKPWLFLAPMAGVADWAFREICYRLGADAAVSHLVPVSGLIANPKRVLPEIGARHGGRPFVVQLIGQRPEDFAIAARVVADHLDVAGIDINMGCPVVPIVARGGGSALLRDPERAADVVANTCAATRLPVSVKLRSGWDAPVAAEIAPLLEAAGAKALFVHGRTREQHYRGIADRDTIAAVRRAVTIPVVANGDVVSVASAREMLAVTGADGVMVGRGALGNPWLFGMLRSALNGVSSPEAPFAAVICEQVRLAFADLGARKAAQALRKHLVAYANGSPSAAALRKELETLHSYEAILCWVDALDRSHVGQIGRNLPIPGLRI